MDSFQPEEKKSFTLIYAIVAVFYAIMITVYAVVVHSYTVNDGADNVVPDYKECPDYVPSFAYTVQSAVKNLLSLANGVIGHTV